MSEVSLCLLGAIFSGGALAGAAPRQLLGPHTLIIQGIVKHLVQIGRIDGPTEYLS